MNSQIRCYQNGFALGYSNDIGQSITSLLEDITIDNVYRVVKNKKERKKGKQLISRYFSIIQL